MFRWRPGALPIFWQTLLLLFASLIVSQAVALTLLLSLDPPRPDFNRLSDVADALVQRMPDGGGERQRERRLEAVLQPTEPLPSDEMVSEPRFTRRLARRMEVDPARVRLYFEPDQRGGFPFRSHRHRMVPLRRGEPIFFNRVVAGLRTIDGGWRVVQTPPKPLIAPWQRGLILWFAVGAVALLPFAWLFARAISRPIRSFARAADRLGADPQAPSVPEEGPAELRMTAHALNRMQERLAQYVSERTAMIGAIAHDLRTPLARIAFRIEAAPEPVREKVQADIEQMRAMIAATIGFVRHSARPTDRRPLDLAALLRSIVEQDRDMGRDVSFSGEGPLMIAGDPLTLGRLFQNLIDNGVTYGGAVVIHAFQEGSRAIVTVADRGPGLLEELLDRVFQPFERADPSRNRETGGIGLGLTIARAIAEDHGGTLTLANRPGGGLEARCSFPRTG
ncbi:two-component sensor histidine kinase [Sphingomonas oleivorans]|uniref:histidine kinase n=1 Tax=Sphingomonas oleivorans TaxID=1735121 RepID=A0A2T5FUZ7_9SPHN|nr:ATP-binding protein [Sphingomonas oleivorans]PTQ08550.1 two-component sensor histidine kinase [Sphingomonas oleivorans]